MITSSHRVGRPAPATSRSLTDLRLRANARVVAPAEQGHLVLHGFIRDQQLHGVAKVTVALYDSGGNWIKQLGFAGTSANGYFRLDAQPGEC
jgi:hypothetical protein